MKSATITLRDGSDVCLSPEDLETWRDLKKQLDRVFPGWSVAWSGKRRR